MGCNYCGRSGLAEEDFPWKSKVKGVRHKKCKLCMREYSQGHYLENKAYYFAKANRQDESVKRKVVGYLESHPCVDCGEGRIVCLDFDHVSGVKTSTVGVLIHQGAGWSRIEEEIRKCEVRCANCHRIRHSSAGNFYKVYLAGMVE